MRGHKDEDCKKKYDANNDHDLDGVNTQIAEQTFSKTNLFRNVKSINETFTAVQPLLTKLKNSVYVTYIIIDSFLLQKI